MITPLADRKRKAKRSRIIGIVILCLCILLMVLFALPKRFGGIAHFFASPAWKAKQSAVSTLQSSEYLVRTKKSVFRENELLKQQNEELKNTMIDRDLLYAENTTLKELFHRTSDRSLILASVLARPDQSAYDTFVLDAGSRDGVTLGSDVFVDGTILIGTIREVYDKTSLAVLYSSPGEVTAGVVVGSGMNAELTGRGGGSFEIVVPRDLVFAAGMTVASPSLETSIIAQIEKVISDPRDPFQKVIGKSPINMHDIRFVQIEKTQ